MPLSAGTKLGPYEILAPIGAGGMGEVYKARDSRLGREVAVKVLPERLAGDPQALARFEREAQAVAALSHPSILVLHDVGAHEGIAYAVTELLEGKTLRDRLSRSALPWRKTVELGADLAQGLAAAHSKGITHRDLKPDNIFLTSEGRVKILDFGLARWEPKLSEQDATITLAEREGQTEAGTVMGTVGYMSPEQVRGEKAEAASDLFSLGCVLYEMVTGHRAFSGRSAGQTMAAILKEDPPAIADSGKQVPAELERVIERCLAKEPGQRFHSAHDLAFALRGMISVAGEKPIAAERPPPVRRHAAIWAAAVLTILAAAGFFYWRNRAGPSIDSLAVLPFVNMGRSADADYLSDGITDSLIDSLSELPNLKVMSHSAVYRYKGKETDPKTVGRELGVRAVVTGRIMQRGDSLSVRAELVNVDDNSALWGDQYNRKLVDALAVQDEIAHQIAEKLRLRLSNDQMTRMTKRQTANPEAYQLYLKGRYYAAKYDIADLNKGLDYLRQATVVDPNYALAYDGLSYYYYLVTDWLMPASEVGPKQLEAARKARDLDPNLVEPHVELGNAYLVYSYDWDSAEREYRRALELNPNYAPAHEFHALYLLAMGHQDESVTESRKAEALDPTSPEISSYAGWILFFSRRYDEAVTELRKCLDLDSAYWPGYYFLGQTYNQLGRFPEAIAVLRKAQDIYRENSTAAQAELVRSYALSSRRADALRSLNELLALSKRVQASKYLIATAYAALGDKDQAFARLEQAVAEHAWWMPLLKVDPELDPLRSDRRFQELVRKMDFPQ
jgi:serine/threonine protein kinase/cytochrome c-type biogenesis protein CcmH/NrfG